MRFSTKAPIVEMGIDNGAGSGNILHGGTTNLPGQGQTMGERSWVGQKVAAAGLGQRRLVEESNLSS